MKILAASARGHQYPGNFIRMAGNQPDTESLERHNSKRRSGSFNDEEGKLGNDGRKRRSLGSSDDEGGLTSDNLHNEDLRVGGPYLYSIPTSYETIPARHPKLHLTIAPARKSSAPARRTAPPSKGSRMTARRMAKPSRTSSSPDPASSSPDPAARTPDYDVPDHGLIDLKEASAAKATSLTLLRINDNREALCDLANGPLFLEWYDMAAGLCKRLTQPIPPAVNASHRLGNMVEFYLASAEKGAALTSNVFLPDNGVFQVVLTK
ncbi:hypothetical protein N7488_011658 [Penicillium malachiteum]|nr:hypothetical protein N7488_011658 [Penicillium malachiteum]